MKAEIFPSDLSGRIKAPGSKSIAQRMAACALLARGETIISHYPDSEDCIAAMQVIQNLGAIVSKRGEELLIRGGFPNAFHSGIRNPKEEIVCGESGLASRMFSSIAALHNDWIEVKGKGSLLNRPFDELETFLPLLGARCKTT